MHSDLAHSQLTLPVDHVSDTAYMVAAYRMVESQRKDALFHDDLATDLLGPLADRYLTGARHAAFGTWMMAVRTYMIDQWIEERLREGADLVVNLAAGLDTRPYRLSGLNSEVQWLEVDFTPVISHKNQALAHKQAKCQLDRIGADLTNESDLRIIRDLIRQRGSKAVVLTEGLLLYLEERHVDALAKSLHANLSIRWWITEFASPDFLKWAVSLWDDERSTNQRAQLDSSHERAGVAFKFVPDDLQQFFAERGWRQDSFRSYREESMALSRMPPGTGSHESVAKVLDMIASSGYGVLVRA